ncbi:aspartic peptidase domain-containing protein [Xylogone sp. PMI_703]|nr:aspartic peptidase domain-containing protein [Xylogone sp. PMI_703]
MILHLSLLVLLFTRTEGTSCGSKVVSLPLKDVQVLPDIENSLMRGIPAKVGTPSQDIVVLPWAELNNTWLYDYEPFCDDTVIFSDTICRNASTTYEKDVDIVAAGGASAETDVKGSETGIAELISTSLGGTDSFAPGTTNLTNFSIGIPRQSWDHGYSTLHAIGMGPESTYLKSLLDAGQIVSKVWSIFWGRMWVDEPLDGSVVLGGYDQVKVIGQNYTQPLDYNEDTGCWTGMKVAISDIELIDRNGDTASIFPKHLSLPVCIVPQRQLLIEAPSDILQNFENLTDTKGIGFSTGLHWSAILYDADNSFDGDMSITFSSGLQIHIPNDQYMVPFVDIDTDGSQIFNQSQREFLFNVIGNQPATLGRYFLTSAYLMVNHDEGTFTLWQANPSSDEQLIPVISKTTAAESCTNSSRAAESSASPHSTSISSSSSPASLSDQQKGRHLSSGTVVAVVIGVIATLRKKRTKSLDGEEVGLQRDSPTVKELPGMWIPHEMEGNGIKRTIYEMDGGMRRFSHTRSGTGK